MNFELGLIVAVVCISRFYVTSAGSSLTEEQEAIVINAHNGHRATVANGSAVDSTGKNLPSGQNIYQLTYSKELGEIAQNFTDSCDPGAVSAGQNVLSTSGSGAANIDHTQALEQVIAQWYGELANSDYSNSNLTLTSSNADSFTQLVWGRTTLVGCGVSYCPDNTMLIVACNYYEVGNVVGAQIYEKGKPCAVDSDCTTFPRSTCNATSGLCLQTEISTDTLLTDEQKQAVVDAHNDYRATVANGSAVDSNGNNLPTGQNIYQLTYSDQLGKQAQNWSNTCEFNSTNAAQNIYTVAFDNGLKGYDHAQLLKEAIASWYGELATNGDGYSNLTLTADNVNSFTQVVWGRTTFVGCGVTYCTKPSPPTFFVVCDYEEAGNEIDEKIYEEGVPCVEHSNCTTFLRSSCNTTSGLCIRNTALDPVITDEQEEAVVRAHNEYRATVANGRAVNSKGDNLSPAKNMYQVSYSKELGEKAQVWTNNCQFKHSNYGQNGYKRESNSSGLEDYDHAQALRDAAAAFYSELAEYGVYDNLTLTNDDASHFSQEIWARSTFIGCGVTFCQTTRPKMVLVMCDYYVVGNVIGEQIYEKGDPCAKDSDCTTFANSTCNADAGLCVQTVVPQADLDKYANTSLNIFGLD